MGGNAKVHAWGALPPLRPTDRPSSTADSADRDPVVPVDRDPPTKEDDGAIDTATESSDGSSDRAAAADSGVISF